jgi:hypothetical protein
MAAPLTPYGQLPFFIEYLKAANLFDALAGDCPLAYTSPNAPEKRDVLGTAMLSVLAGHKRYAHITALRNDGVLPELLGMKKIVSEDAVRRGFKAIGADEGREWLRRHLDYCVSPLLAEPWILDRFLSFKNAVKYIAKSHLNQAHCAPARRLRVITPHFQYVKAPRLPLIKL